MLTGMTKFIAFVVIIVASVGLLSSNNTLMEQPVRSKHDDKYDRFSWKMTETGNRVEVYQDLQIY